MDAAVGIMTAGELGVEGDGFGRVQRLSAADAQHDIGARPLYIGEQAVNLRLAAFALKAVHMQRQGLS